MEINAAFVKDTIRADGIDLVGIADAKDLILANPPRPAIELMPTAKSVIVMAVAHSLGTVFSPDIMIWTRNKMQTSRILDQVAEKMGRLLERVGYLSMPVSADKPAEIFKINPATGKRFRQTKVLGHLSFKHAAVSCGMGQIGRSNLLLSPEFGPHQRLCGIVTEAPLDPDPRAELDLCIDGCKKCEDACPVGALKNGKYNVDPCFVYWCYGFKLMRPEKLVEWPAFIKMIRQHNRRRDIGIEAGQTFITDVDHCIECMRACPVGSRWKKIRPKKIVPQKSGGTE